MARHYAGKSAIVFFGAMQPEDPGDRVLRFRDEFQLSAQDTAQLVHAGLLIVEAPDGRAVGRCHDYDEDVFGFCMAWDGHEFVSENT